MRLTLRTMLAYMDDTLEPEDAEDIGKKIEESELAQTVMHRIRESMRRARLSAPPLQGHGIAIDANTVAQYIENELPAEQVSEFEQICLESDVHLSEVAACHQILTLVLGVPAEVDPDAREKMYGLISRDPEPPPVPMPPTLGSVAGSGAGVAISAPRRVRPEVPEYLRESRRRRWPSIAVLFVIAALVGGITAFFVLPQLRERFVAQNEESAKASVVPKRRLALRDSNPSHDAATDTATEESVGVEGGTGENLGGDAAVESPEGEATLTAPLREPTAAEEGVSESPPEPEEDMVDLLTDPDRVAATEATEAEMDGMPSEETDKSSVASTDTVMPPARGAHEASSAGDDLATGAPDEGGEALGRYPQKTDPLFRLDRRDQQWRPLAPMTALSAGDRLLSLPLFRPDILLSTGVTIQAVDASRFELLGLDEQGIPTLAIDYGRFLLFTAGKAHNQIRLRLGDRQGLLTFNDGQSTLALEVRRKLVPGKDPTLGAGPLTIDAFVVDGQITWEVAGRELTLKAPAHAALEGEGAADVNARIADSELPKWVHVEPLKGLEKRAVDGLKREIQVDNPLGMSLKELTQNRRSEVRSLAICSTSYLGDFEPLVAGLNKEANNTYWGIPYGSRTNTSVSFVDTLRAAMARSPETALLVREAFEKQRGEAAPDLFRMLWGYTSEDLSNGEASKLVEYLNSEDLDFRVLAILNLKEITGMDLGFHPESAPAKRRKDYPKWKERLKDGKIVYASPSGANKLRSGPTTPAKRGR